MKPTVFSVNERCAVYTFENGAERSTFQQGDLSLEAVQLHFVLKGHAQFWYNNRSYQLEGQEDQLLLLFNTQKALPIDVDLSPNSAVLSIVIDLEQLHAWFSEESQVIPFFEGNSPEKKYYSQDEIRPAMAIPLNQLMYYNMHRSVQRLYFKAKVLEIMALALSAQADTAAAARQEPAVPPLVCPPRAGALRSCRAVARQPPSPLPPPPPPMATMIKKASLLDRLELHSIWPIDLVVVGGEASLC